MHPCPCFSGRTPLVETIETPIVGIANTFIMNFGQEYLALVFTMCFGVIQISCSYSKIHGMLIFRDERLSVMLGTTIVSLVLIWFFWDGGRNIPDTDGGVAGFQQFTLFLIGSGAAFLLTSILVSIRCRSKTLPLKKNKGLLSLGESSYIRAVFYNLSEAWKLWRKRTRKYSSG